ncbi:MAG: site-specific integrase [Candidatus Pacebacteria bacterium]|nr:site-specific integrase [Candidatus Paceibacterota bacterium]
MSRLYKRGNVYWYDFQYKDIRYRKSTGKTKRRDAEDIFHAEIEKAKTGECSGIQKDKFYKFAELANEYLKWAERQRSYKDKKRCIRQLVEIFGNHDVNDLNTREIEQWQSRRLKYNKPSTVNRFLATLKHMVNKGTQWGMASDSALKQIRNVKLLPENNRRLRFLSIEECQRLIECCHKDLKPIVVVALNTGMRRSEIFNLKWEQVDLRHGFILLDVTKNGERREIPINTTLEYLFKEMPHSAESEYVFAGKTGKPLTDIKKGFHTALRKAGISDFRFHDLRHCVASHLVMNGIDLTSVKEILGHKSLAMTMRYAHLAPGHKRKAVHVLDRLMEENKNDVLKKWYVSGTVPEGETRLVCPKSLENKVRPEGIEPSTH